ncbi:hypothetical protein [Xanthomonas phage RTH11]|nr:hypothetical protein [Xanthomonas phage RTH11]
MLEQLREYLDSVTTPELSDLILDACKTLSSAGLDMHEYQIQQAMAIGEGLDSDSALEGVIEAILPQLLTGLKQFGVYTAEGVDLRTANSIFKGILLIEDWDDPVSINGLTAALEGEEAALADILVIVGDLTIGDYMNALERVSPDLIARIDEMTSEDRPEPQPDSVAVASAQMRLRALLGKAQFDDDSLFIKAMDANQRLGLSFELTFQPHLDALHQLPLNKLGRELVAFALASSATTDEIPLKLNRLKESFNLSITDLMSLDADIKKLL